MPVTTKDIARATGLSHSTVSRVLNAAPGQRIAEETRQRVLKAAQRMEYQPNMLARSLKMGRTNIVGFYAGYSPLDVRHDFDGTIVGGLQQAAAKHRLDLLLHSRYPRSEVDIYNQLHDGLIAGLFVFASPSDPLVERIASSSLHAVAICEATPLLPSVVCDDAGGMRQLIEYLWAQGHRRIGFVEPGAELISMQRRRTAFREALLEHGVVPDDIKLFTANHEAELVIDIWRKMPNEQRPTALCCWNDGAAYWLLQQCKEFGIRVPDDLAITGFDGFLDDKLPSQQLLTIDCPWSEVSAQAMENLVKLMQGEEVPHELCLPVKLIVGDTA